MRADSAFVNMKDGDITDQRPYRRKNDIAEMREQRRGRGKREEAQGIGRKKAKGEGCDGKLHRFISYLKKKKFMDILILISMAVSIIRVREVQCFRYSACDFFRG